MVEDFVLKMKTLGYFQASSVAALYNTACGLVWDILNHKKIV